MLLIRDHKDPSRKSGNNQRIPVLDVSGYDAFHIVQEQNKVVEGLAAGSPRITVDQRVPRFVGNVAG